MMARREKAAKPAKAPKTTPAQGSSWTHGRQMGRKGAVRGPVRRDRVRPDRPVRCGRATGTRSRRRTRDAQDAGLSTQQQTAGGYAEGFVASWLSATKDEPGDLATYVDLAALRQLLVTAWEYRDLSVVAIAPVGTDRSS